MKWMVTILCNILQFITFENDLELLVKCQFYENTLPGD